MQRENIIENVCHTRDQKALGILFLVGSLWFHVFHVHFGQVFRKMGVFTQTFTAAKIPYKAHQTNPNKNVPKM